MQTGILGNHLPHRQQGAVLLVAMVLLLITSILAFSSMQTSMMEQKMATSRELKEHAFQAAEAAIEDALNDLDYIGQALVVGQQNGSNWPSESHSFTFDDSLSANSTVRYLDRAHTEGYSMRRGTSGIATYYYQVDVDGTRAGSNVVSQQVQGFFVEGPRLD